MAKELNQNIKRRKIDVHELLNCFLKPTNYWDSYYTKEEEVELSPIHYAIFSQSIEAFKCLIQKLDDPELKESCLNLLLNNKDIRNYLSDQSYDINMTDEGGHTILMYAIKYNSQNLIDHLLAIQDIDINIQDNAGISFFLAFLKII